MMTEEEAKTKWCPFAREDLLSGPPFMGQPQCIASGCMAWRAVMQWEYKIGKRDQKPEGDGWEWDTLSDDRWERALPSGKGYCGLAGRPA